MADVQRREIERLQARAERKAKTDTGFHGSFASELPPSAPPTGANGGGGEHEVGGSTAGAGSGDFHRYRTMKNAERKRLGLLEKEAELEAIQAEYAKRVREMNCEEAVKRAKRANKRKKRKDRKKNKPTEQKVNIIKAGSRKEVSSATSSPSSAPTAVSGSVTGAVVGAEWAQEKEEN